jgi:hypothetical protein
MEATRPWLPVRVSVHGYADLGRVRGQDVGRADVEHLVADLVVLVLDQRDATLRLTLF